MPGVEDRHAFVSTFGGGSRYVVDFLVDAVLEAHDPEMQSLMLRSSILERLCGSLCDAVVEQEGSEELLAALSRANLFLLPLDDRGEWYRFHHLFAQLLRVELEHREPGLAPTLHRRAFSWHRDNGLLDQAIDHAVKAGSFAAAGDLIAAAWVESRARRSGRHGSRPGSIGFRASCWAKTRGSFSSRRGRCRCAGNARRPRRRSLRSS